MLKIVAELCTGGLYGNADIKNIPEDEKDHNGWWYFHGKLDNEIGFDKGIVINAKSEGLSEPTVRWIEIDGDTCIDYDKEPVWMMHADGVYPVKVVGIDKPCVGYFWTTEERLIKYDKGSFKYWNQRGLVCYADDYEARNYASKKFKERSISL